MVRTEQGMDAQIVDTVLKAQLVAMRERLDQAAGIAKAAEACGATGNIEKAVEIALDVEQLIFEVSTILNAASLLKKMSNK